MTDISNVHSKFCNSSNNNISILKSFIRFHNEKIAVQNLHCNKTLRVTWGNNNNST